MQKREELITITAGGEPGSTNVQNAYSVLVGNNVWYFYNKGDTIYTRRKVNGTLETTDYRVILGDKPIALYNFPYIYLFFERDDKIFVKQISYDADPNTISETSQQDNNNHPNIQKYDYDATYLGFSNFDASWNTFSTSYFTVSGGIYTFDKTITVSNNIDLFIVLSGATFVGTSQKYVYGMLFYQQSDGYYVPLWSNRATFYQDNYIFNHYYKRPYFIQFYSEEGETSPYYSLSSLDYPSRTTDVDFTSLGFAHLDTTWNAFAITASYDYLKLNVTDNVGIGFANFDTQWNAFAITASYDYLKVNVSDSVGIGFAHLDTTWNAFSVTSSPLPADIDVVSPYDNEIISESSTFIISWNSTSLITVNVEYSITGGSSWVTIQNAADTSLGYGSVTWTLPDLLADTNTKIKVSNGATEDIVDFVITIKKINIVTPSEAEELPTEETISIDWTCEDITTANVYYKTVGNWNLIAPDVDCADGSGSQSWLIPTVISDTPAQVLVNKGNIFDLRNVLFIIDKSIKMINIDDEFIINEDNEFISLEIPIEQESLNGSFGLSYVMTDVEIDIPVNSSFGISYTLTDV